MRVSRFMHDYVHERVDEMFSTREGSEEAR